MLFFENDYGEGAHEDLLAQLVATNKEKLVGYGEDAYSKRAKEKIRNACGCSEGEVFLLSGGTQTNTIVIHAMLASYEGVLAADTGHIAVHEAGAIEATGHKVMTIPHQLGKIQSEDLLKWLRAFYADGTHEHMVFPGMVYLSHPTEYGTLYSKKELTEIYHICQQYEIPLFIDGARLGYGLAAKEASVTLKDLVSLCDVFYIGGTKVGALCGEAVVFTHKESVPKHFVTMIKQHGGLLAKGRLLGVQFDALFTDNLYLKISQNAIEMAELLKEGITAKGYDFFLDSPTNQQFVILTNQQMVLLAEKVRFSVWEPYDEDRTVVRFATSWATKREDITALLALL